MKLQMRKIALSLVLSFLILAVIYNYRNQIKLPGWLLFNKQNIAEEWQGKAFVKRFLFNRENALDEWQEKIFRGRVLYVVKPEKKDGYLFAESIKAASGIFYRITFDPLKTPMISWKWQVIKFPEKKSDVKSSKGWIERDDYAARFYVIFPSFYFMNTKCLEYVWDENIPKGQILTSPYFKNIKLVVAESGKANLSKWVFVERNIVKDYEAAFGRPLKQKVGAIAIMTNADNTASVALAEYSDIKVGYEK